MAAQSAKPRVPGDNVRAFLKREEELRTCREDVKVTEIARGIAIFEEKGVRKASDSRRARQAKEATEELGHLNYELKVRRRARLKDLYGSLEEQYEKELNSMGLAFIKERD